MKSYYDSIYTLPEFYFDLINKTIDPKGDCKICKSCKEECKFKFLMINEATPPQNVNLERLWSKIYDQFLEVFGLNQKFEDWMRYKREEVRLYVRVYLHGEKHLKTLAEIRKRQAEELMIQLNGGSDKAEVYAAMSKFMGYPANPMKMSVFEFYSNLKLMRKTK